MVEQHYARILDRSRAALAELTADPQRLPAFTQAHNDADDLDKLIVFMAGRPEEEIFSLARVEYQHALFSAAFGQYRQAHVSLRLFLELSLCSILFSAHEIDSRRWLQGRKDSNWASIISNENGVFSKQFVSVFFEDMKEFGEQYRALAEKLYRECSEYVHGNRQSYDGIDAEISFNEEAFDAWVDRADTARLVVKFSFICRFLLHCTPDAKNEVEALAMSNFGQLLPIQAVFDEAPA